MHYIKHKKKNIIMLGVQINKSQIAFKYLFR